MSWTRSLRCCIRKFASSAELVFSGRCKKQRPDFHRLAPLKNLTLLDIPSTQEFSFRIIPSGIRRGNTEIINVHPRSGEPKEFMASPNTEPLTEDYSVVALVRGLNQTRSELILAGTTTIGTQAAVELYRGNNLWKNCCCGFRFQNPAN